MAFHHRSYRVHVLLAGPQSVPVWAASSWHKLASSLPLCTTGGPGKVAVRTTQYDPQGRPIAFGRLGWGESSFEKWTHPDPCHDPRRFAHAEVWSPAWTQCARDDLAPDFYFAVANEVVLNRPNKPLRFNQRIIAALATDQDEGKQTEFTAAMQGLAQAVQAAIVFGAVRPWGRPLAGGFTSAIQDLLLSGLFQPGDPHARALDGAICSGPWQVLAREPL